MSSSIPSSIFNSDLLAGRVALVTGGGSNLGRAAATELAACGATVVIAGRREEVLAEACEAIGPACTSVAGDIRRDEDAERIVRTCLDRHGRLDVLVNNAGGQYFVPAEAIEPKGWRAVTGLNVGGTARMTRLAAGHFDTASQRKYPDVVRKGAARSVPLQRLGREQEHAWLVALAASPLGRALSGSVITLDGARDNWFGPWPPASLVEGEGGVPTEQRRARP